MGFINYNQNKMIRIMIKRQEELVPQEKVSEVYLVTQEEVSEIYSKIDIDGNSDYIMEYDFRYVNRFVKYNKNKIYEDIIKKCYKNTLEKIKLEYEEYIIPTINGNDNKIIYKMLNTKNFTMTIIDNIKDINNKILTEYEKGGRIIKEIKNTTNINIKYVDIILNSLIKEDKKEEYKNLMYNLIVNQTEERIIFNDYGICLLTEWLKDLLYTIRKENLYIYSSDYYDDKEVKKNIKINIPRCIIIDRIKKNLNIQIEEFTKLGIKNIIVCRKGIFNEMYNIENYRMKLESMEDLLIKCVEENGYNTEYKNSGWKNVIKYNDSIFSPDLMFVYFLKWCCTE